MSEVNTGMTATAARESTGKAAKAVVLLRVGAAWALLTSSLHTLLFLTYAPKHGPDEIAVVGAMKSHVFNFSGTAVSYWGMYFGYGLLSTLTDFVEGVLLWQLASIAKSAPSQVRPVVALFLIFNIGHIAVVTEYFFRAPLLNDVPLALILATSLWVLPRSTSL